MVLVPQAVSMQFGPYLTARRLFIAVGWPVEAATNWSVFGSVLDVMQGANPALDQPIPFPPGQDVEVILTAGVDVPAADSAVSSPSVEPDPTAESRPSETTTTPQGALKGLDDILAVAESIAQPAPSAAPTARATPAAIPPQHVAPPVAYPTMPVPAPQMMPGTASPAMSTNGMGAMPAPQDAAAGPAADRVFASIEADWRAIEQLERQLAALTKQLNGQASKLQSLNRDLAPQERLVADSNDVKEWNDVRRMLRDAAANISKQVRAFDIGTVSAAGNRNRFQEIFTQYVQTRTPFDGMQQTAHEFEQHRKVCQSLMTKSGSALTGAQRDAEGKARTVLGRIRAKQRKK